MIKSVYIHIPFCKSICSYCDFCKYYYNQDMVSTYLKSLKEEISEYDIKDLDTIYIGGGTPSDLSILELKELFNIKLPKPMEYTIECNINSITKDKLELFKEHGINRISIGIQTVNDKYLKLLNRNHTKEEVIDKIKLVKEYFNNINVDLMYAFPNQTLEELESDIDFFLLLDVPHISTYSLMIEPHTVLYNKKVENIDEDLDYKMYELICSKLDKYHHYEISNFSYEGYESKHNLVYWNNLEYYGFGMSASGYINNRRYTNTMSLNSYSSGKIVVEENIIERQEKIENEFMLGLRKLDGIDIHDFEDKYSCNPLDYDTVKELINKGLLEVIDNKLRIKKEFIYTSNNILVNFIDAEEVF